MNNGKKSITGIAFFVIAEAFLLFLIVSSFGSIVSGGLVGGNVTVPAYLQVGNVSPEILNITINNYTSPINLIANSTQNVSCQAIIRDWNNATYINNVTAQFFLPPSGSYGGTDNNNYEYSNNSCNINYTFGSWNGITQTQYLALGTCNLTVWYYADPGQWNCTMFVNTTSGLNTTGSNVTNISQLLAIGLPNNISYGTVNATYVSTEAPTNVTNVGNVNLNLSLQGYGTTQGDGLAMNCSLGSTPYINISLERYNLTASTPGQINYSAFSSTNYTNLTSSPVVRFFNLSKRTGSAYGVGDTNATYWRIYVPNGVAGNCTGYVVFGATTAPGS